MMDLEYEDLGIANQNSTLGNTPLLPVGFGTLENIVFVTVMVLLGLALAVVLLFCKKPAKKMGKPLPEKISLHSTKRRNITENQTERTL